VRPACVQILAAMNRKRSRAMASVVCRRDSTSASRLAMEQLHPDVQVVGEHRHLKEIAIHIEPLRRMRRQAAVVVGFLDEILRASTLIVEPDHIGDRLGHVGDEDAIDVSDTPPCPISIASAAANIRRPVLSGEATGDATSLPRPARSPCHFRQTIITSTCTCYLVTGPKHDDLFFRAHPGF